LERTESALFFSVFIPGILQGIITAIMVVLIPALGSYVIPDLVGGPDSEMIGNKIAQRTFVDRNLPHASAMSALLTLLIMLPVMIKLMIPEKIREMTRIEKK
jgi:spermidine/putrescine transport system permease protein